MLIKTTVKYDFTPCRMATIKVTANNKCCQGYGEKGTLVLCWRDCKLLQPVRKTVWRFIKGTQYYFRMDKQAPNVQHRELCSIFCDKLS